MPTYVYKFVKTGETIEVQQSFTDDPLTQAVNPRTGRKMAVKKVFTPVGVTFRGDGFYKTDRRSWSSRSWSNTGAGSWGDGVSTGGDSKSDSTSTTTESKTPKTSSTSSSTSSSSTSSD